MIVYFGVDRTLLNSIVEVLRFSVVVVTSLGKLIRFPPMVSHMPCVLAF